MATAQRIVVARKRRKMTAKELAAALGISTSKLSRIETGKSPLSGELLRQASDVLSVSEAFLRAKGLELPPDDAAIFRSLVRITSRTKSAAASTASYAFELSDWLDKRYSLPKPHLPSFSANKDPELAASELRAIWRLGERPIGNIIQLLESKGIRVFSLAEDSLTIDAFSCWRKNLPYVFLKIFKSTERMVFDAAHELGHLIIHSQGSTLRTHKAETDADDFAAAFLLPKKRVCQDIPSVKSLDQLIEKKGHWGVSLSTLLHRLYKLGKLTQARYRRFHTEMWKTGYECNEPNPMRPMNSSIWKVVLTDQWRKRKNVGKISKEVCLPEEEVTKLVFLHSAGLRGPERRTF